MLDVFEQYAVLEAIKRGEIEGLIELLESDNKISRAVRDGIIALLKKNPPKKPKGRPKEERPMFELIDICKLFIQYYEHEKLPVDDALEKMAPITAKSVGTLKEIIYSDSGKGWLKAISKNKKAK